MTEAEWMVCAEPREMFAVLRPRVRYRRKCRLLAVACCRAVHPGFPDPRSRKAVDVAERHADDLATDEELASAKEDANAAHAEAFRRLGKAGACLEWAAVFVAGSYPYPAAENVSWAVVNRREGLQVPEYRAQQGF